MTTQKPAATKAAPKKPATKPAATKTVAKPAATKPAAKPAAKPAVAPAPAAEVSDSPKRYRMLTGIDDSAFCQKVSDALDDGYELYGSPTMTFNGTNVIVGQAVVLKKGHKKGKRK